MLNSSPRQFERLLQLDTLIRARQGQSAKKLAEKLEVSERTIHSDVAVLRDQLQAPLVYDRSLGYHYHEADWRLPLVPLTQGELFALVLGSRMLNAVAGTAYAIDLQSALDQLVKRLPEQTWVDLQTVVDERIHLSQGSLLDMNPEIWKKLTEATQTNQRVEMTYYTASRDSISTRKFDPYLLHIYRGTNPYTIGYCHQRKTIRWFRVDRIRALRVTQESFERDRTFDPKVHLQNIFQAEVGGEPQQVRICFTKRVAPYIRERCWHPTQEIVEHGDGSLTLQMAVPGLAEVKRWVLGYGQEARVEKPEALVEMLREEVVNLYESYKLQKNCSPD